MPKISPVPYFQEEQLLANIRGAQVKYISKPGIPGWNEIIPATELLAEQVNINPGDSILILGSYQSALPIYFAKHNLKVSFFVHDQNYTALEMVRSSLELNHISSVAISYEIELPRELYHHFSKVIIQIPKGRKLFRRWLIQALYSLDNNGKLYIAGANNEGIHSSIKDAHQLFGNAHILGYKKGNRVAECIKETEPKSLPDWAENPGISPGTWVNFTIEINDHEYQIHSLPGVFSYDHFDAGTEMLLSSISISPGEKILDVGCGYGIMGMFAASNGASLVHLIDNNLLAVASCRDTLAFNQVSNTDVYTGDLLNPVRQQRYDLIISNPPFHAGFELDHQIAQSLISQSFNALNSGGKLVIVANRFLRYMNLIRDSFGSVSILKESEKYHVLCGLKLKQE